MIKTTGLAKEIQPSKKKTFYLLNTYPKTTVWRNGLQRFPTVSASILIITAYYYLYSEENIENKTDVRKAKSVLALFTTMPQSIPLRIEM